MNVNLLSDDNEREQFAFEVEKIVKECPHFVKYLNSLREVAVSAMADEVRTEWLLKNSGALGVVNQILSDIRHPRGESAEAFDPGMVV